MACTGPTTEEGKAISSRNALQHGATSRAVLLPGEEKERYEALVADTIACTQPEGERELTLAVLVANTLWRHMRLMRIEAEFMAAADGDGTRPDLAVANLFGDPEGSRKLRLILRYVANAAREYRAAVADLRRVQQERREAAAELALPSLPRFAREIEAELAEAAEAQPESTSYLTRAQRREQERAQRKAEKKARQSAWSHSRPAGQEFVSYSLPEAA
jgi:hypothetical protein